MIAATWEISLLAPSITPALCMGKTLALGYCLEFNPFSIACDWVRSWDESFWTQEGISAQGLVLGSRSRHSSTESGLAFSFHLAETKNWGVGVDFQSLMSPGMSSAGRWCWDHSIVFQCSVGALPFRLSSGVVLHKALPMCSFFLYVLLPFYKRFWSIVSVIKRERC